MMLSNVNNTGLIGRQLYAIAEDGDKSIAITDEGLVIGKNLNDDPEFVTLNSDGITRDGVTTTWADIGGGGGDISPIEEELEDINEKLTAVGSAPNSTTLKVNKKIVLDDGTNNGSVEIDSNGNFVLTPNTTKIIKINGSRIAMGNNAGNSSQSNNCIAIGTEAGMTSQQTSAIAIGEGTGRNNQSAYSVAVGVNCGRNNQGSNAVAIGWYAGNGNQGSNAVAIGPYAGYGSQHSGSIILNANTTQLNSVATNSFYVSSVRNITGTNIMTYNTTTKEISYSGLFTNGTWTPTLTSSDSTMTISPTYSVQYGVYQRDCNVVFINGSITLTSKGNTANTLRIGGIPIAFTNGYAIGQLNCYPMISNCIGLRMVGATGNLIKIQKRGDAVSDWTDLTINDIGDTTVLTFSCTYYLD